MHISIAVASALAIAASASPAFAQANQTTVLRAPVAAIAIGPSRASVDVNVNNGGNHTVVVRAPLVAGSTPLFNMRIRVN